MTAAVVLLASAIAVAVSGLVALAWKLRDALLQLGATQRSADRLQAERDTAIAEVAARELANAELVRRLVGVERELDAVTQEKAHGVADKIRRAPGDGALDELRRVFEEPLLPDTAGGSTATDRQVR